VLVDPAGLVVTNNHVIEGADQVKLSLADKREFEPRLCSRIREQISRCSASRTGASVSVLGIQQPDQLEVGDVVLAVGNPFGVGQTVTHGIVSAVARTQVGISDYQFFIQTDAAINPGNSGGALVDMAGRMVGINTAIFSRSGGSQGVGFAIPANMVRVVVASARSGGSAVKRPWLGAKLQSLTPELSKEFDLKRPAGAVITSVAAGSPAARAGLKVGDVIVAVDSQAIDDPNAFNYRFSTQMLGGQVELGVVRRSREQDSGQVGKRRICRATKLSSRARRFWARRWPISRRRLPMSCGWSHRSRAWLLLKSQPAHPPRAWVSCAAMWCFRSTIKRSPRPAISIAWRTRAVAPGASSSCAAASRFLP
jgi:S1-C subfamily serine protease